MDLSPNSLISCTYVWLQGCSDIPYVPDRLSCSCNHRHHCVHDRFHESVPGLLLYGRDNPPSGVSGSYSKRSDKFSAV